MANSTRQQKFSRLIQRDLSELFQRDKWGIFNKQMVSIADVSISPDLSVAKIYLSMMLVNDKEAILDRVNNHKSEIRRDLGNRIGKQVRIVPDLVFYIDEVEERASRIDQIIDSLDIPPASDTDEDES